MRKIIPPVLDKCRIMTGELATDHSAGLTGAFVITYNGRILIIMSLDGDTIQEKPYSYWEHVSVHAKDSNGKNQTPTWDEMSYVKDLFWAENETVVQFHVPKHMHINNHPNVLHLWRHKVAAMPLPPKEMV